MGIHNRFFAKLFVVMVMSQAVAPTLLAITPEATHTTFDSKHKKHKQSVAGEGYGSRLHSLLNRSGKSVPSVQECVKNLRALSRADIDRAFTKSCEKIYYAGRIGGVVTGAYWATKFELSEIAIAIGFVVGAVDMAYDIKDTGKGVSAIIDPSGTRWPRRFLRYLYGYYKLRAMVQYAGLLVAALTLETDAGHETRLRLLGMAGIPVCASSVVALWRSFMRGNKKQPESAATTESVKDSGDTVVRVASEKVSDAHEKTRDNRVNKNYKYD